MTKQVSGTIFDLSGAAVANAVCTVTPLDALVGQDGGARVANTRTYTADGSGVLTIPAIEVGRYKFTAFISATPSTAQTVAREGVLSINTDMGAEVTLEDALLANAEPVTPSFVQQALDAAERADRALAIARVVAVTTSRNLADTDAGALLQVTAAATLTIPTDASAGWSDNLVISILRDGVGACAIQAASGVTLSGVLAGGTTIADQYQFAQLVRMGANSWRVTGWITEVTA